ncbi:retinitis pigmentosa 1-like 1 protein isoform X3 [Falco cherrug]|uniref:retinitis pigmentosa 1-like 1 protein isoform X3 n=1 Tax=Falco cherrug TaxID=345164 RepID=UPI002479E8A7|nr:retinitis pigmentosa 1-like 1 protein isoform X3 [Falco cherrug]
MNQMPDDYLSTTSSYNYEQPFPTVARTSTVTRVPPAKKITFFKSGDPQFAGVKMAINQRSFKSFNALMDDLSHRVPLPFGVRTITTPRGIHCISELDQLEDGGCYLCSDKKYVKPINITSVGHRPGPPRNGRPSSTMRRAAQEGKLEDYSAPFTHHGPRIPKKITLVKNGESGFRRSIILNRRNARSFKTLLDEISEILQFPVKKLYTADGKKIDSMQALLHCPSVLVCVGREPFKPVSMENLRKHSVEKLPNLAPRSNGNNVNENNEMNFGLEAKKSVIHPRSASSNRSMRFSLSSEKSYPNGLAASPDNGAPFSNGCSHSKPGDLVHSLVNDDIEKRVHVNKDGSLSVEMKVRFRLLNDETLQWSTQIRKSNLMNQMPCQESGVEEDSGVDPIQKMNPEASSEADESLYPCDIDSYMSKLEESECDEAHCHSCGKKHQDYDIWKNPMHTSQREEPRVQSTWHTRSSCSSTSSRRRVVHRKMASMDSLHTTSSEEFSEHIVQESSSYSETIENRVAYRSIKKCMCRSDLSTGASNGEDQQEYTRTSTGNSQRPSSLGLMSHSSCENNLDTQDAPEDHEASKKNLQNEDESCSEVSSVKCLKDDMEEVESSRVASVMSGSSLQSRQSKKNVCEETSSVGRSMSSSSLQNTNQENNTKCSTPASSVHSKSSNCATPRAKSEQGDHSDDNVVSSFSSESCPKKEDEDAEAEQGENEINDVSSVSAKTKPSQSVRDESSDSERCSTQGTSHSRASDRHSKRSDSNEIVLCNASCSSKGSKKSKHSYINVDAQSEMSVSSLESTWNKKKNSLHADDARSCSRASNYSKSSCEIKKKSVGDAMSHRSGSLHSNISFTSEAEVIAGFTEEKSLKSTTNAYSESSKGSKKRSHREENSKTPSLCSSVSSPNEKAGEGRSKINSEATSRQGSMSESVCSKSVHSTGTGIRNGNPASVFSRASSKSEVKGKCSLTQTSQESNDRYSQSNVSQSSKARPRKTTNLHVKMSNSSRASLSENLSVCSMHCPVPPKGKPNSNKIRSNMLKNSSISSIGTESVLTTGKEQKEIVDSSKATSYGSKSAATEINDQENKEIDDSCNRKVEEELEDTGVQEEGSDLMPSALPNTSPEEVVQEWLSKIPSETLLMKYEMEDGAEEECNEATTEVSNSINTEEISENEKAEKKNVEEAENEAKGEEGQETEEGTAINEEAEVCVNQEESPEALSEAAKADQAECSQSVTSSQNNNRRDLPTSVKTSVQIMKALLSSKHETKFDRSHSLPEVSPTMGRKLSNSANILITCLASLQLLDENSEDPSDTSKYLNKSRYMELLNIFQALWFGCTAEKSGPSSGQEASEQAKTASGFKSPKSVDYDFTPLSSSGVDVSSGSGGSVEDSTAGAKDCALMAQKTAGFKSVEPVENVETGTELTEAEGQSKEEELSSRPSTACSKSKGEEKAQSTRGSSVIQEAEENKEDQCSNCENGQEEGGEGGNQENSKLTESGEQEAEAVNDELPKENLEEEADQLATTDDANVNDADCGTELKAAVEEQLGEESPNDPESKVDMTTSMDTTLVQQKSADPDPVWVLRLLKKIEKEFMAHYVSAMNEFKVRWNLQNNQQTDKMILELKEEVSKRIQRSIEKELRKIKTRAGKNMPRPPDEPLKHESTLQIEQRRRRLQTIHKMSLFSEKNGTQTRTQRLESTSDLPFDVDEDIAFDAAFEASTSTQSSEEEYCPCDSCLRKKMASKPIRNPVVATNAPIMKAFDLQQILRLKKNDNEEACVSEAAQDTKTIPSSSMEEAAENGNPKEENDAGELQPNEMEVESNEEKEAELNDVGSSALNGDGEGPETAESQNCEMEDEETKEEENEEAEEVGEETKEREEEEDEAKEEEEEKEEEEITKAEEEETKEEEGETKEKEDEELKEEAAEEVEIKEEEEKQEEGKEAEEEETKEEEEEVKQEEEEEVKVEEEETKEEEEGEVEEEEEVKEEDEETKEEEEGVKEEEEETKEEEEEEEEVKVEEEETKEEEEGEGEGEGEEEETKEEEEEVKEEEEETKGEEEEEVKEEETKEEDEEVKEKEEEKKEEQEEVEEDEEEKKDEGEEVKEDEEEKKDEGEEVDEDEEETKEEEEEEVKEDEEEKKEEEEEVEKDEEETNEEEEEEVKEDEEEKKEEEEEVEKDEEETKEEEEGVKEEDEGKKEDEDVKDEEETKEEEKVQEEEDVTKEDEEAKEDEEETKPEEQEVEEEEENPKEEEEEAKEEEEINKEEKEANGEEEDKEDTQNEEQEAEEKSKAEDEADNEAEEAEEPEDEDIGADDVEEMDKCRGDAGSGTDNNPEDVAEGNEEAEQDEAEAVEDTNPESEGESCSAEENNSEGDDKYDENDEKPTSDNPDKAHEKHEDKGNNKVSESASKIKGKKTNKRLETLNKTAAYSCYSSVRSFSHKSQKGSEDEEECKDDTDFVNNHPNGEAQTDESSKPSQMYPDSEEEEEDKASSCTDPLGDEDPADAEGIGAKEVEHTDEVQASKKKEDSDHIDQDDLDF